MASTGEPQCNDGQTGSPHATSSQHHAYPPAPNPSADPGVLPRIDTTSTTNEPEPPTPGLDVDIFVMASLAAMKLLARFVQTLADMTGDVPPTPPISRPGTPSLHDIRNELLTRPRTLSRPSTPPTHIPCDDIAKLAKRTRLPIGAPEVDPMEPTSITSDPSAAEAPGSSTKIYTDTTFTSAAQAQQRTHISRKFFSKRPPPISIHDYLHRLHRYCPMSTAVYLAAGHYINQLSIVTRSVPVTGRTVHRLLLASLRVAMKALEDLSYPHKRFAGVGGVGEGELARLEVTLCYLMNFDLRVAEDGLRAVVKVLSDIGGGKVEGMRLKFPSRDCKGRRETVA